MGRKKCGVENGRREHLSPSWTSYSVPDDSEECNLETGCFSFLFEEQHWGERRGKQPEISAEYYLRNYDKCVKTA
jgi:hypothetical protein